MKDASSEDPALGADAYHALDYNQQLVQFADSKAGTLIVINSLFIAAAGAVGAQSDLGRLLQAGFVIGSAVAVLYCLSVVMTRGTTPIEGKPDLIFFADILKRQRASAYSYEFRTTSRSAHMDAILRRTFVVAEIAQRKFASYTTAQTLTAGSAALWLASNVLNLLR
ncbi:MAG: hypothetical protein HY319_08770 [Armatimonadetes bacterium]|nr:hypothetical protein [Armatimonadota bacterium]